MADEQNNPPPQKNGPCFFGEEHSFTTIGATDPFTGEAIYKTVCSKCGAGA